MDNEVGILWSKEANKRRVWSVLPVEPLPDKLPYLVISVDILYIQWKILIKTNTAHQQRNLQTSCQPQGRRGTVWVCFAATEPGHLETIKITMNSSVFQAFQSQCQIYNRISRSQGVVITPKFRLNTIICERKTLRELI